MANIQQLGSLISKTTNDKVSLSHLIGHTVYDCEVMGKPIRSNAMASSINLEAVADIQISIVVLLKEA